MTSSSARTLLALQMLTCAATAGLAAQATRAGAIIGSWHGTSTCVRAPWNAACHDEVTEYDFIPASADSTRATVHAFKLVQGQRDSMGALPVAFAPVTQEWNAQITTRRGDARWTFRLHGDTLLAELFVSPDMRIARHVVAVRRGGQPAGGE